MAEARIRIENVTKSFGHRTVLRGVNLDVPAGCLYGLIGPGAAGKSVLLKLITGLLKPDAGKIVVDEKELGAMGELDLQGFRLKFGMLFQNNALFDYMTVGETSRFRCGGRRACRTRRSRSACWSGCAWCRCRGSRGACRRGCRAGRRSAWASRARPSRRRRS